MKYLAYHSIGKDNGEVGAGLYCVKEGEFRKQMEYVAKRSETVSCGNSFDAKVFGDSLLGVSFDDGDISNYKLAYPILKEFGLKAYFFIIGNRIGTDGYMDWDEIKELRDNGMIIGSHGMTHRILAGLSDDELDYELKDSKKILEENLDQRIDYISIPRGFYTEKILEKIKEAGYKKIFTSDNRVIVKAGWDIDYFKKVMENGLGLGDRVKKAIKECSKKILGAEKYDKIRTIILR